MSVANSSVGSELSFGDVMPKNHGLYYGGVWNVPQSGRYRPTFNPANGQELAQVAQAESQDVYDAVRAANMAFAGWRRVKSAERGRLLRKAADILRANAVELAMLDAFNAGNPVAEMVGDAHVAAATLEYFAGLVTEIKGETIPMGEGSLNYSLREPLGVVARIVAYNHPLMFAATKLAAPLAAGNTVIIKPSEQAPLSALRMAELLGDIFPPGVVNVVTGGRECGAALSRHEQVRKITLIGSTQTGRAIMKDASDSLKQVLFELGGKNPLLAYPDADLDLLADGIVRGMNFTWAGQSCGSTSRVFLHEDIHDQVLQKVVGLIKDRHQPGAPTNWTTTMGPVISQAHYDRVMHYIDTAQKEGARLVTGGKRPDNLELARGYFIEPTVFSDVRPEMTIAKEEIFGPVMAVFKWHDEETLIQMANNVEYGLTASIWSSDLATAHRTAGALEAGYVWVNNVSQHFLGAPFGGYKSSGLGREECLDELLEFTQLKSVNVCLAS